MFLGLIKVPGGYVGHSYPSLYATGLEWRKLLKLHRGAFNYVLVTMQQIHTL